ncbi:uncharacterized protein LOC143285449 [Babylonia areolata]|uniref:uncharacterized protein LOC143285449 n=1 Tax=Babylonia areolata TaxID=304850 RepID=UPI003FD12D4D
MENERTERDADPTTAVPNPTEGGGHHGHNTTLEDDVFNSSSANPYYHHHAATRDLNPEPAAKQDTAVIMDHDDRHSPYGHRSSPHPSPDHLNQNEPTHLPPSDPTRRNEAKVVADDHDDSFDSVILEEGGGSRGVWEAPYVRRGLENEAYSYDGDAETDQSYSGQPGGEPVVLRSPDPFPLLDRPVSGRYQKNPSLEKSKAPVPPGPYDPQVGVFLAPPLSTTKTVGPTASTPGAGGGGGGSGRKVRRRIPRPPSRVRMRCALLWSCLACLLGNFVCAIPALRYYVTANESRKIGDFNSANSYLRKTAILATVAMAVAVGAWTVVILHLSGSL